ncbi:MAG TPA: MSMEG_0572/Sll0783 family nitrogen starvation response protein, partial [Anaeromyxobacteraceae bacterium]|nr:MSMEG_0572/Sll0783 family nitrogen starvation response protein [Anaeromyxobacteraceae bacterium]
MANAPVQIPPIKAGDAVVDMTKGKIYEDFKAKPGEKALIMMHTVPFEGSVGLINMLTATRLIRKGYEVTLLLYGPGVLMASQTRGFPVAGEEGFAGNLNFNKQLNV